MKHVEKWKTADEIEFIEKLGFHAAGGSSSHYDLVKGYAAGLRYRVDWDGLDEQVVWKEVKRRLVVKKGEELS